MQSEAVNPNSRQGNPFFVAAFVAVLALLAWVLIRWPDNFYADDSYFYFQVAWNIARGMGSTFNNILPTNGYHPLWMLVCVATFKLFPDKNTFVHAIGAVIALLDCGALLLLCRTVQRRAAAVWWPTVLLYGTFALVTQLGTEGALSGFFLAATVLLGSRLLDDTTPGRLWLYSLAAALAVLSRLDSIFIIGLLSLSLFAWSLRRMRPAQALLPLLIFPILWGAYVASNLAWFGTVQPISGMLKSHAKGQHALFANLPHLALISLLLVVAGAMIVALRSRDQFFLRVELPFTLGVLIHASYITFVMSDETRWTWYYTSWWLLAALLSARAAATFLRTRPALRPAVALLCLLLFAGAAYQASYKKFAHYQPDAKGVAYQSNILDAHNIHSVLAFDKPGRLAYYSSVQVVALDGLMGDLQFQKDLQQTGILTFDHAHQIQGFVGPPVPFSKGDKALFCDHIYLESVQLQCAPAGPDTWMPVGVMVYARLTGAPAGTIPLTPQNLVWNHPHDISLWRLQEAP